MPAILIVDDYADALEAWEIFLRAEGFDVISATTGAAALQAAVSAVPSLIVMDLMLPDLSGIEVARMLRAQPSTARIPLVAATGLSDPDRLAEARAAGFDAILIKPCEPAILIAKIRELLAVAGARHAEQRVGGD